MKQEENGGEFGLNLYFPGIETAGGQHYFKKQGKQF